MMEAAAAAAAAVLAPTTTDLSHLPIVAGYDFNEGVDYERLLQSYLTTGFQAGNLDRRSSAGIHGSNKEDSPVHLF